MRIAETVFGTKEWLGLFGKSGENFFEENGKVKLLTMKKIGGHILTDYGEVIDNKELDKFDDKKVVLDNIREDSEMFKELTCQKLRIQTGRQAVAPFVKLPGSWDEYLGGLNKKKRHELKRKMRRVGELGEVDFKVSEDDAGSGELIRLIKKSSKEKREFMNEQVECFFRKMMRNMSRAGWLRLFSLKINGKTVAMCLGFEYRKVLSLYNSGFKIGIKAPVGMVMMGEITKWAIKKDLIEIDFLRGGERYKYDLGAKDRQLWRIIIDN